MISEETISQSGSGVIPSTRKDFILSEKIATCQPTTTPRPTVSQPKEIETLKLQVYLSLTLKLYSLRTDISLGIED
jgi:hypothetical protein